MATGKGYLMLPFDVKTTADDREIHWNKSIIGWFCSNPEVPGVVVNNERLGRISIECVFFVLHLAGRYAALFRLSIMLPFP